jgi:MFS family permease
VCLLFACFGTTLATWAVHLPTLQHTTGMTTAMVGTLLLISGVGALAGMQVCGVLLDRLSVSSVTLATGVAMAVSVLVPLAATTTAGAVGGALLFGVATGSADVSMNSAAVGVERAYGRPIMASFHAVFSLGSVAGSLLATIAFALHLPARPATAAVSVLVVAVLAGISRWLTGFSFRAGDDNGPCGDPSATTPVREQVSRRRVVVLGVLAFLLLLSEGGAMDWSSLHAQQHFAAQPALGSLAFGCFVTAMTVGRLCVDGIAARIGPVAVVRWGCALAAVGIGTVIVAPVIPVAFVGWLMFGLGLAGGIPQVFTAAGDAGQGSGRVLARVVGMGYVAMMAGPALIGWLAQVSSMNAALLLPLGATAVCGLAAAAVGPRDSANRKDCAA